MLAGRKVSPHSFGHSYITHIWEQSDSLRLAKHLAGHENIRTTSAYCHVTPRKERERLAEYLGKSGGQKCWAREGNVMPAQRDASGRWLKNTESE